MTTSTSAESDQFQNIFDLLNSRPPKKSKKWWNFLSKTEIRLWILIVISIAGAIALALCNRIFHIYSRSIINWAYGLVFIGQIGALLIPVLQIYRQLKGIFDPLETFFASNNPRIIHDHGILVDLCKYDSTTLGFLSKRLELEASQLRKRIGYVAPGIEKIGALPAAVALIVSSLKITHYWSLFSKWKISPSIVVCIAAAIGFIYFTAFIFTLASDRIDQLAQLLSLATGSKDDQEDHADANIKSGSVEENEG
jgi:hypothetical protein